MSIQPQKPTVKYHTRVNIDENGKVTTYKNDCNKLVVNHVVKVVNGTLESVLHLIGYSYMQMREINRKLSIRYNTEQNQKFELSLFDYQINTDLRKSRPPRAHIVQYHNRLYGVIVDGQISRICGHINKVIACLKDDDNILYEKGVRINRSSNGDNWLPCDKVRNDIDNGKHVVCVSEKGALFVVPDSHCNEYQSDNKLLLVLGHGFVVIDDSPQVPVVWIRSRLILREERREESQLLRDESIIVSFAAIAITSNDYKVYGTASVANIKNIQQPFDPM